MQAQDKEVLRQWYLQLVGGLSTTSRSALWWEECSADSMALWWVVRTMAEGCPVLPGLERDLCMNASLSLVLLFMSSHLCLMSFTDLGTWLTDVICLAMPSQILSLSAWHRRIVSLPNSTASFRVTSVTRMSSSSLENLGFLFRSAMFLGLSIPQSIIG